MNRRGILLAGGANSRFYPATLAAAKSLLPIYDKPLAYYPLAALMEAGVSEVLVIAAPPHLESHRRLLGDGGAWGMRFSYLPQTKPRGIADAFLIGAEFVGGADSALALADNVHYGGGMREILRRAAAQKTGATVFAFRTPEPERFGVAEFGADGEVKSLEEKPARPKSNFAVTGLYFYDSAVCEIAAELPPSARGELEITDINRAYLRRGALRAEKMPEDAVWFDAGTPESLAAAADFVRETQRRKRTIVAAPEEIAWRNDWITREDLSRLAAALGKTQYAAHLQKLAVSY
ncbi:MAG: glucose-1-phosphate thymidylyltransferase RfbA [Gammaproteobacteria bacterium]